MKKKIFSILIVVLLIMQFYLITAVYAIENYSQAESLSENLYDDASYIGTPVVAGNWFDPIYETFLYIFGIIEIIFAIIYCIYLKKHDADLNKYKIIMLMLLIEFIFLNIVKIIYTNQLHFDWENLNISYTILIILYFGLGFTAKNNKDRIYKLIVSAIFSLYLYLLSDFELESLIELICVLLYSQILILPYYLKEFNDNKIYCKVCGKHLFINNDLKICYKCKGKLKKKIDTENNIKPEE